VGEEGEEASSLLGIDDEFARALAKLSLAAEGGGLTWEELIERLINPGIPGDGNNPISPWFCIQGLVFSGLIVDEEFLTMFLAFYRKFAAPSKLLQSLIAKYEEGSRSAIDYMLKMIVQTRYSIGPAKKPLLLCS
jgi:hypothetical protein